MECNLRDEKDIEDYLDLIIIFHFAFRGKWADLPAA